jgi:hypothetical protein
VCCASAIRRSSSTSCSRSMSASVIATLLY